MKKVYKSIFIVLVVVASLFFLAGQSLDYFVFKYRQAEIRKDIKKQIKNGVEETDLFVFSYREIQGGNVEWVKEGKEFRLNGKMYDIVHIKIENGSWIYQCIDDSQEAKLFRELDQLVQNRMNNDSSDDYLKNLIKDFVKVYFQSQTICFYYQEPIQKTDFHFSFLLSTVEILSPPPRLS